MILRYEHWQSIREKFSHDEKCEIHEAIDGQLVCPRGWAIDEAKLRPELLERLK